jgi:uncharacterized protein (DUF58 family)
MATQPIIDKAFLEKLERLALHWQQSFHGLVGGHVGSRSPGSGQEFLDHRHFHHGDDLRAVNWQAYLRLEKLFLKMFQVEPRIPVRLLLDVSQSMATGTASKFAYARRLAAALCYIALIRLDAITLQPFSDHLGDPFLCSGGRHRIARTVDYLGTLSPGGRTNYLQVMREFSSAGPPRGLLIVLSDFLDDQDCIRPLQYLADFGHELLLVHLWAEEDRTPPWDGDLDLTDAETGRRLEVSFGPGARAAYTEAFDSWARSLQEAVLRKGGRYVGLPTSTSMEEAIFGPLLRSGAIE